MFLLRRPSARDIDRFLGVSRNLPFSYEPIGIVGSSAPRRLYTATTSLGRGPACFERARGALREWQQFNIGWIETFPPRAPLTTGTVVGVLIRHLGFWSLNGCRVAYELDEPDRFGFAYGTLTNHAESGEELFEVWRTPLTHEVFYGIRATSWPQAPLAWLGHPIARLLQARFRADSTTAMRRAVERGAT